MAYKNHIQIPELKECVDYPVGMHIARNIPKITIMANAIAKYADGRKVRLICRGSSGSIISGVIASQYPQMVADICYLAKSKESRHSDSSLNFIDDPNAINVVVDDFMSTGNTIRCIFEDWHKIYKSKPIDLVCLSGGLNDWSTPVIRDLVTNFDTLITGTNSNNF